MVWHLGRRSADRPHLFRPSDPARGARRPVEPLERRVLFSVLAGFEQTQYGGPDADLSNPTSMDFAPDGRLFVTQQGASNNIAQVRVFTAAGQLLSAPFLSLTVDRTGERGLLGLTFDPNFATNGFVYVYHTVPGSPPYNQISRYKAADADPGAGYAPGNTADPGVAPVKILQLDNLSTANNHNGGAIHFAREPDGVARLYVAVGDNANGNNAQSLTTLHGKMLRLNADGTAPSNNPFNDNDANPAEDRDYIWALGLRNPFTFAVTYPPSFGLTTPRIYINDVGQNTWEEINEGVAGANYGWPGIEGVRTSQTPPSGYRDPVYAYRHGEDPGEGEAITGGAFYDPAPEAPAKFPVAYNGDYFFADHTGDSAGPWIRVRDVSTGGVTHFATLGTLAVPQAPVDLKVGPDGSLYYLTYRNGDHVGRIRYTASLAPNVSDEPDSLTVTQGGSATFSVTAAGDPPLQYQWQRANAGSSTFNPIAGATGSSYTLPAVQSSDNGARFRVVVTNTYGSDTSAAATLTVTTNRAPTATITAPADGATYEGGQTITYAGTGTDPENGNLPASAFTWQVDFHHADHSHPFIAATSGATGGSFVVPRTGETAADVFYRIQLTVRDAQGLTHTTTRDVRPQTSIVTLQTSPAGLTLNLDGQPKTAPHTFDGVEGITRTLEAPATQTVGGVTYRFVGWSDGGARQHDIETPQSNTTYTAAYAAAAAVLDRHVFYNNSAHDGGDPAATPGDDAAVAPDKDPMLPGATAGVANFTSFDKGINGIQIDLDWAANFGAPLTADDFEFRHGNGGGAPSTWTTGPTPTVVDTRRGAGASGSTRVTLVWPDYNPRAANPLAQAVANGWLRVTVKASERTGLTAPDVFYFGNAIGDTMNSPTTLRVNSQDVARTRNNQSKPTTADSLFDHNRDGRVNSLDVALARGNQGFTLATIAPTGAADVAPSGESTTGKPRATRPATRRRPADDLASPSL